MFCWLAVLFQILPAVRAAFLTLGGSGLIPGPSPGTYILTIGASTPRLYPLSCGPPGKPCQLTSSSAMTANSSSPLVIDLANLYYNATVTVTSGLEYATFSVVRPGPRLFSTFVCAVDYPSISNNTLSLAEVQGILANLPGSPVNNLENALARMSYGRIALDSVTVRRLQIPQTMLQGADYDFVNRCGAFELYYATEFCRDAYSDLLAGASPSDWDPPRIVTFQPPLFDQCHFYGVGTVNCAASAECNILITDSGRTPGGKADTLIHEFGHTIGAKHSSSADWEYGDCNDPMGCANGRMLTQFGAPNLWILGLATNIERACGIGIFSIPATRLSNKNFLKCGPFILSYRSKGQGAELDTELNVLRRLDGDGWVSADQSVVVHMVPGTTWPVEVLGAIPKGGSWIIPRVNMRVTVIYNNLDGAVINVTSIL